MRKDNPNKFSEELAEKLLDAALANCRGAEPGTGLEERVLANLRQQSRAARPVSWSLAPVMIAVAAALMLFAVDHWIYHPAASEPALVAALSRGGIESKPDVGQTQAGEKGVVVDEAKRVKAAAASKRGTSAPHRQDLALNLNSRQADERAEGGLRVEEVRIAEVRLDDIVISNNERQE